MSPDELKARARRIAQELLTQGDLAVAGEIFAPDCTHHAAISIAPGPAGVRPWIAALRRAFPDLRASVEDAIADGNAVAQRLILVGTHEGEWRNQPPTGHRLTWSVVEVLHAGTEGTFTETWQWWDLVVPCQHPDAGDVGP
jgi:predicted ester cyclase